MSIDISLMKLGIIFSGLVGSMSSRVHIIHFATSDSSTAVDVMYGLPVAADIVLEYRIKITSIEFCIVSVTSAMYLSGIPLHCGAVGACGANVMLVFFL